MAFGDTENDGSVAVVMGKFAKRVRYLSNGKSFGAGARRARLRWHDAG